MKTTDKQSHLQSGEFFSRQYLIDCILTGQYIPPVESKESYDGFCKRQYRYGWEKELLSEQGNRCCYCMRRIEIGKLSVEHVIPESFKNLVEIDEYAFYTRHSEILRNHVDLASAFAKSPANQDYIQTVQKLPHLVAYGNLLAACNGVGGVNEKGCCCNNVRGNHRILPLPLMNDTDKYVEYGEDGRISINFPGDKKISSDTRDALNLNDATLIDIRCLWFKVSRLQYSFEEISAMDITARRDLFYKLFQCDDLTTIDERFRKFIIPGNDTYWTIFLKYDWFLGYYRGNPS